MSSRPPCHSVKARSRENRMFSKRQGPHAAGVLTELRP